MKKTSKNALSITVGAIAIITLYCLALNSFCKGNRNVRPTYSLQEMNEDALGETITFNSIVLQDSDYDWYKRTHDGKSIPEGTLRNETNFVGARIADDDHGVQNVWEGDEIIATDGDIFYIRLFIHNSNPGGLNAIAEDTKVRFYIPSSPSNTITVNGWLTSSNATPSEYVDDVTFKSLNGEVFYLQYIYGSALLENGGIARGDGVRLSDNIINQSGTSKNTAHEWIQIGYDALNGCVPGGYKYINYVTIMVRAIYDYDYTVETKVRLADETDKAWKDTIEAKIGDRVEFQIEYTNTSDRMQESISIRDILPSNLRYISDSAKLYNVNHPDGAEFTEDSLVKNGFHIGAYTAGSNAIVRFQAEVVDNDLSPGSNTLVNWGQVGVGTKTIQKSSSVVVKKDMDIFITKVIMLSILILISLIVIAVLIYKIHHWKQAHK